MNNQGSFYFENEGKRPSGSGQMIGAHYIYNTIAQSVDQAAYSIGCTREHVYHLIDEGAFQDAYDISSDTAVRPCWRIPRQDVIGYIENRKDKVQA